MELLSLSLYLFISNKIHHLYLKGSLSCSLAYKSLAVIAESFGKHYENQSNLFIFHFVSGCRNKTYTAHKILFVFYLQIFILTSTWERFS